MSISKIESGGFEVIGSGSVIAYKDNSINITLQVETDGTTELIFVFNFEDDDGEDGEPGLKLTELSENSLEVTIHNHRSGPVKISGHSPPVGPIQPIELVTVEDDKIFLNYSVEATSGDKFDYTTTFNYTFYKGEKANVAE